MHSDHVTVSAGSLQAGSPKGGVQHPGGTLPRLRFWWLDFPRMLSWLFYLSSLRRGIAVCNKASTQVFNFNSGLAIQVTCS